MQEIYEQNNNTYDYEKANKQPSASIRDRILNLLFIHTNSSTD